jgi:hypothetical protein
MAVRGGRDLDLTEHSWKRRFCMRASLLALCIFGLMVGCQTPGKVVATETSTACPKCKLETKTRAIKGLTYKVDVCPSCKTTWEYVEGQARGDGTEVVHVCDECKIMTEKCPVCAQKK